MNFLSYSVVISTYERPQELAGTLASLVEQTHLPALVIIVDASPDAHSEALCTSFQAPFALRYLRAEQPSSARQRNQGAALVTTPLVAFLDDDVTLTPTVFAQCVAPFSEDASPPIAGIAARIRGQQHAPPRGLLWWYYRLQAGYADRDYAARLFGPGINTLPAYRESDGELIPAEWLPTTCVIYRHAFFAREQFPSFAGYSFMEDAHLASRLRRQGALYFHKTALFEHHDAPSSFKRDVRALARARLQNQRLIARELLQIREPVLTAKLFLHRLFISIYVLRNRRAGYWQELTGVWT